MSTTLAATTPIPLFIGGKDLPGSSGGTRELLDPATNRPFASTAIATRDDAHHAMEEADRAFRSSGWAGDDGTRRSRALYRLARLLEERAEEFALLETRNMGKPLKESRGDIGYVVRTLEYCAGLADKLEGTTVPVPGARFNYTVREPLGVTVHIAPWNYPLLLSVRSVAPALAAGNAVVLKPASLTPLTALAFARLGREAGLPDGILNIVVGSGAEVGEALVEDPRCRSVTFTGSAEVGRRISEIAGRRLVPATMELGGKSPVIVFADADVDRAAKGVIFGIFGNAGQMCWAASRLIVAEAVRPALLSKVQQLAEGLRLGPGTEDKVDMGPLVSTDHAEKVLGFVDEAKGGGATILTGGKRPTDDRLRGGNFVEPTVIADVDPAARVAREEVFGPVLTTFPFTDIEEAVRLANATSYGLFASVWTKDLATAHTVARQLEAGMVSVNEAPNSFPQTPFGGYKESGVGSEQGRYALEPFTHVKNVMVNIGAAKPRK